MIAARLDVPFDDEDQTSTSRPIPSLVSLHFLRSALRRRWWVCVLCVVLGLLASVAFLVASPVSHQAKAALVLAHDPQVDSSRAMATDISLLTTRTVASKTIANLGLTMTPDEFLKTMTAEPISSELMSLTLTGPSDAESVRRLTALTSTYLDFRADQLSTQSNVLVDGMRQRIEKLQTAMADQSRRIEQLSRAGRSGASKLSDAIAQRAYFQSQIETLQQSVEDATLRNDSVVSSSRVIDPAAVDTAGVKRRIALTLASGLIGGAALGCGIVLFFAITSDRLRRRSDVAAALGVAVPISVGRIAPPPKQWLWLPHLRTLDNRRAAERQRLAHAIEMELPPQAARARLGVACIDNAEEVSFAVAAAATVLAQHGRSVAVIDLTQHGSLGAGAATSSPGSTARPTVLRPRGVPALASSAADLITVGHEDQSGSPQGLESADVILILADLDPSVGADHLKAWTDRVMVVVTAGRSSAERVRTVADLVRTAGLELRLSALLHTERTDDSSGTAGFDRPIPVHFAAAQSEEESTDSSTNGMQAMAAAEAPEEQHAAPVEVQAIVDHDQTAVPEQAGAPAPPEQTADGESAADLPTTAAPSEAAVEERAQEEVEEPLAEVQATADLELTPVADQVPDGEPADSEEQPAEAQRAIVDHDQTAVPEQAGAPAPPEQTADGESAADLPTTAAPSEAAVEERAQEEVEEPLAEVQATADLEVTPVADQVPDGEPADSEEQLAEAQTTADLELTPVVDHVPDGEPEQAGAPAPPEQTADGESAADLPTTAAPSEAAVEERAQEEVEEPLAEVQATADLEVTPVADQVPDGEPADSEEQPAEAQTTADLELTPVADHVPDGEPADSEALSAKEQSTAHQEQVLAEQHRTDDQLAPVVDELALVDHDRTAEVEQSVASNPDEEEPVAVQEQAAVTDLPSTEEQHSDDELVAEPDEIVSTPAKNGPLDGWDLYLDTYLAAPAEASPSFDDDELEWDWDWDFDDLDNEESLDVMDTAEKAEVVSDEPSLSVFENGEQRSTSSGVSTEAETEGEQLPDDGQVSNGKDTTRKRRRIRRRNGNAQARGTSTRV